MGSISMRIERILLALSSRFRLKRMRRFIEAFPITDDTSILDVGGFPEFWADLPFAASITVLNLCKPATYSDRCRLLVADGRLLPFSGSSFDIAFSNSVIEHLGTLQDQTTFANEIRSVASAIWVQTPARSFPVEPHLAGPFIHYLPKSMQRKLARRFTLWGWIATDYDRDIDIFLKETRLLTYREMKELFPDCEIIRERLLFLTKSYIAVRRSW
jgi:methyltransferase family protein